MVGFSFLLAIVACGGSQDTMTVTPLESSEPVIESVEEEPIEEVDERIWYVYFSGIHCLSIYPQPGQVRGEEAPNNANPTFNNSPNPYFSVVSAYFEREDDFAAPIEAATSLENLLQLLDEMDQVEFEEEINPIYGTPQTW